ncbi:hypothetical protein COBT_000655 [Conglomerata obtusa]
MAHSKTHKNNTFKSKSTKEDINKDKTIIKTNNTKTSTTKNSNHKSKTNQATNKKSDKSTTTVQIKKLKPTMLTKIPSHLSRPEKNRLKGLQKVDARDFLKSLNQEYETTRVKKLNKTARQESLEKLFKACQGKFVILCTKRSSSKVIQCLLKYGGDTMKAEIFNEIKNDILNILCRPFGRFVVEKLFCYEPCTKIVKENVKQLVCDRIGIDFVEWAYKKDKTMIEGLWCKEVEILGGLGDISPAFDNVRQISVKLLRKEMFEYEIAHDIIYLNLILAKNKNMNLNEINKILQKDFIDIEEFENIKGSNLFDKELQNIILEKLEMFLTSKNGVLLAINSLRNNKDKQEEVIEKFKPVFLKTISDKFGVSFILYFMKHFENKKICDLLNFHFEDLFINENSILPLLEALETKNINIKPSMIDFMLEKFSDFIRTINYQVVLQFVDSDSKFIDKSINLLKEYKENKILSDCFASKFFVELENLKLIDLKQFIDEDFYNAIKK